jgi:hypothetical protein
MKITITNTDSENPVITRLMRVDDDRQEIDCVSEAQLLPYQTAEFEIGEGQSLVVFER